MVNWQPKQFLAVTMALQLALLGLVVGSNTSGFDIPFLRQALGFVCLTFLPGMLILRLLKLYRLSAIDTLLYSVGLSLTVVMFMGFFVNIICPMFGISRPITSLPLIITLTAAIAILCLTVYIRERRQPMTQTEHKSVSWAEIFSPPILFLLLLPLLSAFGSYYLANFQQNNILLLVLIALIALVAIMVVFNKFIPPKLYSLAIVMIAISLLWHWSLISQYLVGNDIFHEYYFQNLVLDNGFWDSTIRSNVNSMLSTVMLAPIYSLILNMDPIWIFKIVYPLFFSLLPVALFQIYQKQTGDKIAFFAVFFFISFSQFFMGMTDLPRQQVAELFFALFVLVLSVNTISADRRRLMLIFFGFSIAVSHYGLSYFFLFYLVLALLLLPLIRRYTLSKRFYTGRSTTGTDGQAHYPPGAAPPTNQLTTTLVFIMITFCFVWYMYIGAGSPFNSIVNIGTHTYQSLIEILNISTRQTGVLMAIGLAAPEISSIQRSIFLVVQYLIEFFIIAGIIGMLFNLRKKMFQPVYVAMAIVSSLLLLLCIVLPRFSASLNISRIYHITLIFLAPFCVLGGITTFRWILKLVPSRFPRISTRPIHLCLLVVLILVPYFLFNTTFIYAVTGDTVTSIALNPDLDWSRYNKQEVSGKEWLLSNMTAGSGITADYFGGKWLVEPLFKRAHDFYGNTEEVLDDTYIYLRTLNIQQEKIMQSMEERRRYVDLPSSTFGKEVLAHQNKIYDNGGAQVYYSGKGRP
jgi:uncharacterized membrane protein